MNRVSPLFVGRVRERAVLDDALRRAREATPSTVLIGGEAGGGKTRLIREFAAGAQDVRVLVGGCFELGVDGLPFAPFAAVLRNLVRDLGVDGVAALLPDGATSDLAPLLPEFGRAHAGVDEARARLFELVLSLLERLAEDRPVVLIIEDAHWADRSTRDLLSFLVRYQRPGTPLLTLVTFRTDELHRRHPLRPWLAELTRLDWVTRVDLEGLTRQEVIEQARAILEREPAGVDDVLARSQGNPLYVEALLASDEESLPESLRDLLLAGVERLPEEAQEVVRVASAGGVRIEHALLAAVTSPDDAALRHAVAGNVLAIDGEGYAFRHALIMEAVHDDLLPGERVRLHTRYADALEADPSLLPAPRGAVQLAHHWYAARENTKALTSAWRAAEVAGGSFAYDEQLRMLRRVLELWDTVPDAADRIGADHVDVLWRAATACYPAGEFDRGFAFAEAALKEIDAEADPARAAQLLQIRGIHGCDLGRDGFIDDLREATRLVPADAPGTLHARMLESLSRRLDYPDMEEALATAGRARDIAREAGDVETEALALDTIAWIGAYRRVPMEEIKARFGEARRLAARAGSHDALLRIAITESDVLEGEGLHEEAVEVARRAIHEAREHGVARSRGAFLALNLAEPLVSLGRWDEALEVVEHALEPGPPPHYRAKLQGFVFDIALARGDVDRAEGLLGGSWVPPRGGYSYAFQTLVPYILRRVDLFLARGATEDARREVQRALDELDLAFSPRYAWPLVITAARGADVPEVAALAARLGPGSPLDEARRLTYAALRGGDWDPAVEAWHALRQPYDEALALIDAARGGARDAAGPHLIRARELAVGLGAKPLIAEIESLARRLRLPIGGAPREPSTLGLTARELEVFRLVAAGRSNREIAEELFIAVKTVSVHISNILGKLSVSSRGEAAARAHSLGLFDDAD